MQLTILSNLQSPPRTAMEVFNILPEGTLAEVINNVLYIHPSQNVTHQSVLGDILTSLLLYIKDRNLGTCVTWVDVYLDENNAVQPDILFIANKNLNIIQNGKIKGVPDLIVEILSGDRKQDLDRKKDLYEAFSVKEYFIVDQLTKEVITYYFDDGKFIMQQDVKGKLQSKMLNKTFAV